MAKTAAAIKAKAASSYKQRREKSLAALSRVARRHQRAYVSISRARSIIFARHHQQQATIA